MLLGAVQLPPLAERGARERHQKNDAKRRTSSFSARPARPPLIFRRALLLLLPNLSDTPNWVLIAFLLPNRKLQESKQLTLRRSSFKEPPGIFLVTVPYVKLAQARYYFAKAESVTSMLRVTQTG